MRYIFLIIAFASSIYSSAQFHANTLVVESADTTKFYLSVDGYIANRTPEVKVTVPQIYSQEVSLKIIFADSSYAPISAENLIIVRESTKKKRFTPRPYKAIYQVTAKKKRSKIKLVSITSIER
ncbi:MAG: hypothetical protein R3Y59_00115 [bacterium]